MIVFHRFRYYIIFLLGVGVFLTLCYRNSFALVLTHTTRSNSTSSVEEMSLYPNCTTYNHSGRDYTNDFSEETGMQFHTAYYIGIFLASLGGGLLTNRVPAHYIIGIGIFSSSILFLILPSVFQSTSIGVFVIRLLQGLLEGFVHPAVIFFVNTWSLKSEKSTFMAIAYFGIQLGPAFSNIFIGACLCYVSWHSGIYILGAAGTLWSVLWFLVSSPTPKENRFVGKDELELFAHHGENVKKGSKSVSRNTPWKAILTSKHVWAIWVANFCKNVINSTLVMLAAQFFKDIFNLSVTEISILMCVPFFAASFSVFLFSFVADQLIKTETLSVTNVRKLMQCAGVTMEAVFFTCMAYSTTWQMSFVFLTLGYSLGQMTFAGYSCNPMDLSPQYSGAISSIVMSSVAGGIANTFFASLMVGADSSVAHWRIVFWFETTVAAGSGVLYFMFASGEKQSWAEGIRKENGDNTGSVKCCDSDILESQPLFEQHNN